MPSPINTQPLGLLGLLGIKTIGRNPSILPDIVSPIIDIGPLYRAQGAMNLSGATSAVNLRGNWTVSNLIVPPGELWVVESAVLTAAAAVIVGTTYKVRCCVYDVQSGLPYNAGELSTVTAGEIPCAPMNGPFLVAPGQGIGVFAESVTLGTASAFNVTIRYTRALI